MVSFASVCKSWRTPCKDPAYGKGPAVNSIAIIVVIIIISGIVSITCIATTVKYSDYHYW